MKLETFNFEDSEYKIRIVEYLDNTGCECEAVLGTEALDEALFDENGEFKSDEARDIDDYILFYISNKSIEKSDKDLFMALIEDGVIDAKEGYVIVVQTGEGEYEEYLVAGNEDEAFSVMQEIIRESTDMKICKRAFTVTYNDDSKHRFELASLNEKIPLAPNVDYNVYPFPLYSCPSCNRGGIAWNRDFRANYCPTCGQPINWKGFPPVICKKFPSYNGPYDWRRIDNFIHDHDGSQDKLISMYGINPFTGEMSETAKRANERMY